MNSVLVINDVLDSAQASVNGIRFDAEFNVVFIKTDNKIKIQSQQVGPIYAVVSCTDKNDRFYRSHLLLDQEQLKMGNRSLYNQILTAFELEALKQAYNTPDYKWKEMAEVA